jgi:hypothetical protein
MLWQRQCHGHSIVESKPSIVSAAPAVNTHVPRAINCFPGVLAATCNIYDARAALCSPKLLLLHACFADTSGSCTASSLEALLPILYMRFHKEACCSLLGVSVVAGVLVMSLASSAAAEAAAAAGAADVQVCALSGLGSALQLTSRVVDIVEQGFRVHQIPPPASFMSSRIAAAPAFLVRCFRV